MKYKMKDFMKKPRAVLVYTAILSFCRLSYIVLKNKDLWISAMLVRKVSFHNLRVPIQALEGSK